MESENVPVVKELSIPEFSYQKRSPCRKLRKVSPMMHPNTGPTILPGNGRSETPADHKSMSSGDAYTWVYLCKVLLVKALARSFQLRARFKPQNSRKALYDGTPWSRPRCMFSDARSEPQLCCASWNK